VQIKIFVWWTYSNVLNVFTERKR